MIVITAGKGDIVRLVPPLIVRCEPAAAQCTCYGAGTAQLLRSRLLRSSTRCWGWVATAHPFPRLRIHPLPPHLVRSEEEIAQCCQVLGEVAKETLE